MHTSLFCTHSISLSNYVKGEEWELSVVGQLPLGNPEHFYSCKVCFKALI